MLKFFHKKKVDKPISIIPGYELIERNQYNSNLIKYGLISYKSINTFRKELEGGFSSIILIKEIGIVHAIFHDEEPIHRITYDYCTGLDFLELLKTINKNIEYYLKEKDYPVNAVKRYVNKRVKHEYADSEYMSFKGDFLILKDETSESEYNVYNNEGKNEIDLRIFEDFSLRIDRFRHSDKSILDIEDDYKEDVIISDLKNELEVCNMYYPYNRCCLEIELFKNQRLYVIDGVFPFGKNRSESYYKEGAFIVFKNKSYKDFEKLSVEQIMKDDNFEIVYKSRNQFLRANEIRDFLIGKKKSEEDKEQFSHRYSDFKKVIKDEIKKYVSLKD